MLDGRRGCAVTLLILQLVMMPGGLKSMGRRKDSAIRTLVAETLVLAKTHGYVEKIENELEEELRREGKSPPKQFLARWRRDGERLFSSKYMLMTVVLLCVTDCALVLGELILDLHKVKDTLATSEHVLDNFVKQLKKKYPTGVRETDKVPELFRRILEGRIFWPPRHGHHTNHTGGHGMTYTTGNRSRRFADNVSWRDDLHHVHVQAMPLVNLTSSTLAPGVGGHEVGGHGEGGGHSLEEEIAHAFHLASITILAILVVETLLKATCSGKAFCQRKLEVFDALIVVVSFVVDLVFLKALPRYKIQDFVFILAFLLPWRVIRVVNSLVVAVKDHEHFRLKLVYSRKKKIQNSLREAEIKMQIFKTQCNALKKLCISEGIDEWRVDQLIKVDEYVVNRSGKSKCKIKIDDQSVILLNDKTDFPSLSPRASLTNLADRGRTTLGTLREESSEDICASASNGLASGSMPTLRLDEGPSGSSRRPSFTASELEVTPENDWEPPGGDSIQLEKLCNGKPADV